MYLSVMLSTTKTTDAFYKKKKTVKYTILSHSSFQIAC